MAAGVEPPAPPPRLKGAEGELLGAAGRIVARNLVWLASGEVVIKLGLFAAGAIVARRAGPAGMGAFTFGYFSAILATNVFAQGMIDLMVREAARAPEAARSLLAAAHRVQVQGMMVFGPLALAATFLIDDVDLRRSVLAFLPYAFLRAATLTRTAVFRGLDRMDVEVRARVVELTVVLPLLALVPRLAADTWLAGACFVVGGLGAYTVVLLRLRRLPGPQPLRLGRPMVAEALWFLGVSATTQLLYRVDTLALPALGIGEGELGFYGAAAIVVWGVMAAPVALGGAIYPTLARLLRRSTRGRAGLAALVAAGGLIGLALASVLWGARQPLARLAFGDGFEGTVPILGVLVWALPAASATALLRPWLASRHLQSLVLLSQVATMAVLLALDIVLVPQGGTMAAAQVAIVAHGLNALVLFLCALTAGRRLEAQGAEKSSTLP